jgi:hypothetical protein
VEDFAGDAGCHGDVLENGLSRAAAGPKVLPLARCSRPDVPYLF